MNWKIIVDSACDIKIEETQEIGFGIVPIKIQVGDKTFVDDGSTSVTALQEQLNNYTGKTTSACPAPQEWMDEFSDAKQILVITLSSNFSGSNNSANLARELYLSEHTDASIFVLDSKSTSGQISLLVMKAQEEIKKGRSFQEVCETLISYNRTLHFCARLQSIDNLIKNGRVPKMIGAAIQKLGIHLIAEATTDGKMGIISKNRGGRKSLLSLEKTILEKGYQGGKMIISHNLNIHDSKLFKEMVGKHFPKGEISIIPASGICSYYGEEKGILVGFEGNFR